LKHAAVLATEAEREKWQAVVAEKDASLAERDASLAEQHAIIVIPFLIDNINNL